MTANEARALIHDLGAYHPFGMTVPEYAEQTGLSGARIRLLCSQGRIPGAVKHGPLWAIPKDSKIMPPK